MASTYLTRTNGTPTSAYKYTFSCWVKRSAINSRQRIMSVINPSSTGSYAFVEFTSDNKLGFADYPGSSPYFNFQTNRLFRDVSAWYHIVVAVDTTQATASNRQKLYINGVQETSFSTSGQGNQNATVLATTSGKTFYIGQHGTAGFYMNGSMAHVHFIDGTAYDSSAFGETDSTTGIWKPKTAPSVTYGTNGFFLKFENSAAFGTDSSGNSNTFSVNGTMTQTIDTPSNVFATLNAIQESPANNSLSNGNTTSTNDGSASGHKLRVATLGASSGKWYMEAKLPNGGSNYAWCGIISYDDFNNPDTYMGSSQNSISYGNGGTVIRNDAVLQATGTVPVIGNSTILQVAVDLDNNYIYFGIDGTYVNSGDPTSGASGTGGYSINFSAGKTYTFGVSGYNTGATWNCNFGNGYFGTTAVSSAQNPDDGIGIFEYDVPAGYRALNTKSINAEEYN